MWTLVCCLAVAVLACATPSVRADGDNRQQPIVGTAVDKMGIAVPLLRGTVCFDDSECGNGESCIANDCVCTAECDGCSGAACGDDELCIDFACVSVGACCPGGLDPNRGDGCFVTLESTCDSDGGLYLGDGTDCSTNAAACEVCGPPNPNSCFEANDTPGCSDAACCATVCAFDGFCCNESWDSICESEALEFCSGAPTGACCQELVVRGQGACEQRTQAGCLSSGGLYHGDGTDCGDVDCARGGASCDEAVMLPKDNQSREFTGTAGWFRFEALDDGTFVDTCGSSFDTRIEIFEACEFNPITGNDNCHIGPGGENADPTAECFDPVTAGESDSCTAFATSSGGLYFIFVSSADPARGFDPTFMLRIRSGQGPTGACCYFVPKGGGETCDVLSEADCDAENGTYLGDDTECTANACEPADPQLCDTAELIAGPLPVTVSGSTDGATISPEPPAIDACGTSHNNAGGEVWYRVIGTGNTMRATTCNPGTDYDTKLHVYCATCDDPTCVGGNDDQPGDTVPECDVTGVDDNRGSTVEWCSVPNAPYYIVVFGFGGETGDFELTVSDNDVECGDAVDCPLIIELVGACCTECGCEELTPTECEAAGGTFLEEFTSCLTLEPPIFGSLFVGDGIPDNDPVGASYTLNIPASFTVTDVNVFLEIDHTFQGDLIASLIHDGTSAVLFSRPGSGSGPPGSGCPGGSEFGYEADNLGSAAQRLVLDDEASVDLDCYDGPFSAGIDNYAGPARSTHLLSSFDGFDAQGDWTLVIADVEAQDIGGVVFFGLQFGNNPICPGDVTPPTLIGCPDPGPTTLECTPPPPPPVVTATDNCDDDVTALPASSIVGDSCFQEIHRTWTATDEAGNEASCEQNFVVQDTIGPVITCTDQPIVVVCTGPNGIPSDQVDIPTPTAVDDCNDVAFIGSTIPAVFAPTCGGEPNIVTFTANDTCGNSSSCEVEVHVKGALCCPGLVDSELTLMSPDLNFTVGGAPVTTKAKFDIWNQNEIRFSGHQKCVTCWDQTFLSAYPMPNHFLASNIQTDIGRARIDGVAEPQCPGAVATPLLGVITREITFAGCPLPSLRSSRPLTGRGTQDAMIQYSPVDLRSGDDDLRVGPPENIAQATKNGALLVFVKVEVKWDFAGNIVRDTFLELTNDGEVPVGFQLYFVNGEQPADAVVDLGGAILERAYQGWNFTDQQILLTQNEPTYWSAHTGLPKGITPFSNLDGGPPFGRPDPDPRNPGGRMVRGFVVGWAVNAEGLEIKYNRLAGRAMMVDYAQGTADEYESWSFRCVAPVADLAQPDATPGRLLLDGLEYDAAPEKLLTDFFTPGSPALSNREALMRRVGEQ
jgi:subtilisin-like proprotein convertase family protein